MLSTSKSHLFDTTRETVHVLSQGAFITLQQRFIRCPSSPNAHANELRQLRRWMTSSLTLQMAGLFDVEQHPCQHQASTPLWPSSSVALCSRNPLFVPRFSIIQIHETDRRSWHSALASIASAKFSASYSLPNDVIHHIWLPQPQGF